MALNPQNLRKHPNFTSADAKAMQLRSAAARKRNRMAREALEAAGISVLMAKMKLSARMRAAFEEFGVSVPKSGKVPLAKAYFLRMAMVGLKNGDARIIDTMVNLSGLGADTNPATLGGAENPVNVAAPSSSAMRAEAVRMGVYDDADGEK